MVIHGAQIPSELLEEVTAPPTEQTRLVLPETTKATHGAQIPSEPLEEATAAHAEPTHLALSGVITEDRPETTFDRQALRAPLVGGSLLRACGAIPRTSRLKPKTLLVTHHRLYSRARELMESLVVRLIFLGAEPLGAPSLAHVHHVLKTIVT